MPSELGQPQLRRGNEVYRAQRGGRGRGGCPILACATREKGAGEAARGVPFGQHKEEGRPRRKEDGPERLHRLHQSGLRPTLGTPPTRPYDTRNAGTEPREDRTWLDLGTPGADSLAGSAEADLLLGRGGDDQLDGLGGADLVLGGVGNDRIFGESSASGLPYPPPPGGDDVLLGGTGNDTIIGGSRPGDPQDGQDLILGGPGNNSLDGGGGTNTVLGGAGDDTIENASLAFGGPGDDRILRHDGQRYGAGRQRQ